jgi:hypothetical protein
MDEEIQLNEDEVKPLFRDEIAKVLLSAVVGLVATMATKAVYDKIVVERRSTETEGE